MPQYTGGSANGRITPQFTGSSSLITGSLITPQHTGGSVGSVGSAGSPPLSPLSPYGYEARALMEPKEEAGSAPYSPRSEREREPLSPPEGDVEGPLSPLSPRLLVEGREHAHAHAHLVEGDGELTEEPGEMEMADEEEVVGIREQMAEEEEPVRLSLFINLI
jgi:hypothetical protein